MFTDDANLFFTQQDIRYISSSKPIARKHQPMVISYNLSLNIKKKTRYSFFHTPSQKEDIPLLLLKLGINNYEIKRTESITFLRVLLNENLSWKEHIEYNENRIAKNAGLLYKAKHYLNKRSILVLYYSFKQLTEIWPGGSTNKTNLKQINSQQKPYHPDHTDRKNRFIHAKELFQESKILNVFQLNILNNLFVFMYKIISQIAPKTLQTKFRKPINKYPTNFSTYKYSISLFIL